MSSVIEVTVDVKRRIFYDPDSGHTIYGCKVVDCEKDLKTDPKYGTIRLMGKLEDKLGSDEEYRIAVKERKDRYGYCYDFVAFVDNDDDNEVGSSYFDSGSGLSLSFPEVNKVDAFLREVMTPLQFNNMRQAFPNVDILGLIMNDEIDYRDIKGMSYTSYQKIRERAIEYYSLGIDVVVTFRQLGMTIGKIRSLVGHFGSSSRLMKEFERNPYIVRLSDGIGFKEADRIALLRGIEMTSPFRIIEGIKFYLEDLEKSGHCWSDKADVCLNVSRLLGISDGFIRGYLTKTEGTNKSLYVYKDTVALMRNFLYEKYIGEKLYRLNDTENTDYDPQEVDECIKGIELERGMKYNDEQIKAIHGAVYNNIFIIDGPAGTGKTSIIEAVIKSMNSSYICVSLSGKAARVIEKRTGLRSATIHRALEAIPGKGFQRDGDNPLPYDVVIVDEGSMVSAELFYRLLSAIRPGGKVVIVGGF